MTEANPEILNVVIQECGRYKLERQKATLEIHRYPAMIYVTLMSERGPLSWHVQAEAIKRDGSIMTIQGPRTFWRFLVVDHDTDDPRR